MTRQSVCSKPPRKSYEKFTLNELPEEIINSLADLALGKQSIGPNFGIIKKQNTTQGKLPGTPNLD